MEGFADYINSTKLGLSFASFSGHSDYKFLIFNYLVQLFVTIKFSITYNKALYFFLFLTVF